MNRILIILLFFLNACQSGQLSVELGPISGYRVEDRIDLPVNSPSILADSSEFVWGGSCVRGEDGKFHLFYSLFEAGEDKPPFTDSWLLTSKIAHAVSDYPDRDFQFTHVVLYGAAQEGDSTAWDAQGVHNPHIKQFDGRYYLYYIGSRDPGVEPPGSPGHGVRKRDRIQQVQQIGVIAVDRMADLIEGRFLRPQKPLLSPRTRVKPNRVINPSPPGTEPKPDNLVVVNPSVTYRPSDGKYLLYFKGNLWDPHWRGVHGVAIGETPEGPFVAQDEFVFDFRMPDGRLASAEDPYVWYHKPSKRFYAVFKDFTGRFTGADPGLAMLTSTDGLSWETAENPFFSRWELMLEDGTIIPVNNLERPQFLLDRKGNPLVFYAALSFTSLSGKRNGTTYNVQIPVRNR